MLGSTWCGFAVLRLACAGDGGVPEGVPRALDATTAAALRVATSGGTHVALLDLLYRQPERLREEVQLPLDLFDVLVAAWHLVHVTVYCSYRVSPSRIHPPPRRSETLLPFQRSGGAYVRRFCTASWMMRCRMRVVRIRFKGRIITERVAEHCDTAWNSWEAQERAAQLVGFCQRWTIVAAVRQTKQPSPTVDRCVKTAAACWSQQRGAPPQLGLWGTRSSNRQVKPDASITTQCEDALERGQTDSHWGCAATPS